MKKMRILLLEDIQHIREDIETALNGFSNYEVDAFDTLYGALKALTEKSYDYLILDHMLVPYDDPEYDCAMKQDRALRAEIVENLGVDPCWGTLELGDLYAHDTRHNFNGYGLLKYLRAGKIPSTTSKNVPAICISSMRPSPMEELTDVTLTEEKDTNIIINYKHPQMVLNALQKRRQQSGTQ